MQESFVQGFRANHSAWQGRSRDSLMLAVHSFTISSPKHTAVAEIANKVIGEPIPSFTLVNKAEIDNLVAMPQTMFYEDEQYKTFEAKATILFYKINKGHIFPNGNKRMSIVCLMTFLELNAYVCDLTEDELTEKAIWLAQTDAERFEEVKKELEGWIGEHCRK